MTNPRELFNHFGSNFMKMSLLALITGAIALISLETQASTCRSTTDQWPYEYSKSGSNSEINFMAEFSILRKCDLLSAKATAHADGQLYGINAELVDTTAAADLKNRKYFSLDTEIAILGYVVDDFHYDEITEIAYEDRLEFPIEIKDRRTFWVGPVPIGVDYGLVGEGGIDYGASLNIGALDMRANPFVNGMVFASTDIDAQIAELKVYGEVILIQDNFSNELSMVLDQVDFDDISMTVNGYNELAALDGRITMYAYGEDKESSVFERDLIRWNGMTRSDEAYSINREFEL